MKNKYGILVVEPHPDDGLFGCLSFLKRDNVVSLFVTPKSNYLRIREGERICDFFQNAFRGLRISDGKVRESSLEVVACVKQLIEAHSIKIVVIPHENEGHPDHRAVYDALCDLENVIIVGYSVWDEIEEPSFSFSIDPKEKVFLFRKYYMSQMIDKDVCSLVEEMGSKEFFSIIKGEELWNEIKDELFGDIYESCNPTSVRAN